MSSVQPTAAMAQSPNPYTNEYGLPMRLTIFNGIAGASHVCHVFRLGSSGSGSGGASGADPPLLP